MTGAALRLAAFVAVLAAAFGTAWAVGAATGPVAGTDRADTSEMAAHDSAEGEAPGGHDDDEHESTPAAAGLPGLSRSESGYTLEPVASTLPAGPRTPFAFSLTGPDGTPVLDYREEHEKELHLIVVRRDLSGFQHVHPRRSSDGTWRVDLDTSRAGSYRAYADVVPTALGRNVVLGTDLQVAGDYAPVELPEPSTATTVDGYDIELSGHPETGAETELTFTVSRDGKSVRDLQPYLGAFGHLVTIRNGDLAYLHTHPADEAAPDSRGGPRIRFATTFPSAGTYRLFVDFKVDGRVLTAAFTVDVGGQR